MDHPTICGQVTTKVSKAESETQPLESLELGAAVSVLQCIFSSYICLDIHYYTLIYLISNIYTYNYYTYNSSYNSSPMFEQNQSHFQADHVQSRLCDDFRHVGLYKER